MKRVAVIGAGISGLTAAYLLSRRYVVSLFEHDRRLGGHTHTIRVPSADGDVALDTGFLVHNTQTYPNLVRLFEELDIATQPSDMSFSVTSPSDGLEYSSRGLLGYFAQPWSVLRPNHYRLLRDIIRFNREAPQVLSAPEGDRVTLASYVREHGYTDVFIKRYLVPMTSAIWSAPVAAMQAFPMPTLVRFMQNHGMLTLASRITWRVVCGGSDSYVRPLVAPLGDRIHLGARVHTVHRGPGGIVLAFRDGSRVPFDEVVLACHGDQVLPLLGEPSDREREVFGAFTTTTNHAVLHTDAAVLPSAPRARAAWNYRLDAAPDQPPSVTYDLNRLQGIAGATQYCVTLNSRQRLDESKVIRRLTYRHPQFTRDAIAAQEKWPSVSGVNRTHFCGAYWRYGFHEDGVVSAQRVAAGLGVSW